MIAAAQIYFNTRTHPITLESLKKYLEAKLGGSYSLIEWKGYTTTIPRLLIEGSPSWTLQIDDDADYVPQEIQELVDEAKGALDAKEQVLLRACNARLDAMAYKDQQLPEVKDHAIVLRATTALDPFKAAVRKVLNEVATFAEGLAYDLVNGKWITKQ
jgi:hypothetical protein